MTLEELELPNVHIIAATVLSAGQPTPEQFVQLCEAGVKTVVNLRAPEECDWDEPALVNSLGMRYVALPVRGASGITEAHAQQLMELVDDQASHPLLVHCGSANRVGALIALGAFHHGGCDIETAVEKGRRAGLTALEPHVRAFLSHASR